MITVFRKKDDIISFPISLKKTPSVQNINTLADSDLLFPGIIVINIVGIDDSKINYILTNVSDNVSYSYTGNQLLNDMSVGEWTIDITNIDGYIIDSLDNQYLNESKTISFNINVVKNTVGVIPPVVTGKSTIEISPIIVFPLSISAFNINVNNNIYPGGLVNLVLSANDIYTHSINPGDLLVTMPKSFYLNLGVGIGNNPIMYGPFVIDILNTTLDSKFNYDNSNDSVLSISTTVTDVQENYFINIKYKAGW